MTNPSSNHKRRRVHRELAWFMARWQQWKQQHSTHPTRKTPCSNHISKGHRTSSHTSVAVCGHLYCGAHFAVNPTAHVHQRGSSLWQQPTTVKKRDALHPSRERVASTENGNISMRLLVAALQQKRATAAQLRRKGTHQPQVMFPL